MTREEILAMEPGRELDALVCENVFGLVWCQEPLNKDGRAINGGQPFLTRNPLERPTIERPFDYLKWMVNEPRYSDELEDAWEIIEKFDFVFLYRNKNQRAKFFCEPGQWECRLTEKDDARYLGIGYTEAEAICKAALLTMID